MQMQKCNRKKRTKGTQKLDTGIWDACALVDVEVKYYSEAIINRRLNTLFENQIH